MKKVFLVVLLLLSSTTIIADNPVGLSLEKGKNNVSVQEYFPSFPVSGLVKQYPEVDSVTMKEYGNTYGYIRAFGGVGTDFLIQPESVYEVVVNKPVNITLGYIS